MKILVINESVFNVDNSADSERLLAQGARELTSDEIAAAGITGYEHLVNPANTAVREDGSIIFTPPPLPTLAEVKVAKLAEIIAGSNACAALVKSRYSALEIDSWALQQTQAESVLAGKNLPPDALLTVLAVANGVTVQDFATRVLHNVATAEALTKWVVATQQGYEAALNSIMADQSSDDVKIAAIRALDVVYALPEAQGGGGGPH